MQQNRGLFKINNSNILCYTILIIINIYVLDIHTTVDDALSLNLLQGSLYLSKLLITKLYIHMYLYVMYVKSNQSDHTN